MAYQEWLADKERILLMRRLEPRNQDDDPSLMTKGYCATASKREYWTLEDLDTPTSPGWLQCEGWTPRASQGASRPPGPTRYAIVTMLELV